MNELSNRLKAVVALIPKCSVLCDVGCDHGYISMEAVRSNLAAKAIATDVNKGPLLHACENIASAGLFEQIETRLSDGLAALEKQEADCIVIAGMGGPLMRRILTEGHSKLSPDTVLVLQPQSEIPEFRRWLRHLHCSLQAEDMVCEDGKFYPMMRVLAGEALCNLDENDEGVPFSQNSTGTVPQFASTLKDSRLEQRMLDEFGPFLIQMRHPILKEYILHQKKTDAVIEKQLQNDGKDREEKLAWLDERRALRERALSWYNEDTQ